MPEMYENLHDLPEAIRKHIPQKNLQEIYLKRYQESWDNYEEFRGGEASREAVAHRDAMNAVKVDHVYDKETGKWHRRGEMAEDDDEQDKGILETITETLDL
jgi:cation transport regulator ChaB